MKEPVVKTVSLRTQREIPANQVENQVMKEMDPENPVKERKTHLKAEIHPRMEATEKAEKTREAATRVVMARVVKTREVATRAEKTREAATRAEKTREAVTRAEKTREAVTRAVVTREAATRAVKTREAATRVIPDQAAKETAKEQMEITIPNRADQMARM